MRQCITHHHACDCREAEFAAIKQQRDELDALLNLALSALGRIEQVTSQSHPVGHGVAVEALEQIAKARRQQ